MSSGSKSQTTTSSSGVPDWLRPDVQDAFGDATKAADSGDLEHVQKFSDEATVRNEDGSVRSQGQKQFLEDTSNMGIEAENARTLANIQGQQLAGTGGGAAYSARADRARQAGLADSSAKLAGQNLQVRDKAYSQIQQQGQQEGDKVHQGLQRRFGYYGSGAGGTQSTNTSPKSGGK